MSTEVAAPLAPLAPVAEEEAPVVEEQPTTEVDATEDEVSNTKMCNGSTGWPLSDVDFGMSWMIPRLKRLDSQLLTALVLYYNQATTEEVAPSVSEETTPAGEPSASMEKAEVSTEEAPGAEGKVTAEVADSKKRSAEDADVVADDEEMVSYGKRWCLCPFGVM
jgi:hypothetical protein